MRSYVLGLDAELDLYAIWEFIARDDIDAADKWIAKLFKAFESIGNAPGIGHQREDLTSYPLLFWPVGVYLIIYRADRKSHRGRCRDARLVRHARIPASAHGLKRLLDGACLVRLRGTVFYHVPMSALTIEDLIHRPVQTGDLVQGRGLAHNAKQPTASNLLTTGCFFELKNS